MKKVYIVLLLLILVVLGCSGCKQTIQNEDGTLKIYYLNNDITKIVPYEYAIEEGSVNERIAEVMKLIETDPVSIDCKRAFTQDIEILDFHLENKQLAITFNEAYLGMDATREVLCRASIVQTVTQLDFIEYVVFYVEDAPLEDYTQNPVGVMTKDSFIDNTKDQINSVQAATLTLYFANADGNYLIEEIQNVHYSSNMPMEKLVVEQLIAGPTVEDGYQTISPNTKLLSISQKDGVCYVDFDEGFLEGVAGITEQVAVYSVVNSLSEVPNINKIQISINGDNNVFINEELQLNHLFERNLDVIQSQEVEAQEVELQEVEIEVEEEGIMEKDVEVPAN